jgi:hypothetical protein
MAHMPQSPTVGNFQVTTNTGGLIFDGPAGTPNTIQVNGSSFDPLNSSIRCWDMVSGDMFFPASGGPDANPVPSATTLYFTFRGSEANVARRHQKEPHEGAKKSNEKGEPTRAFRPTTIFVTVTNNPGGAGGPSAASNTVKLDNVSVSNTP